jgi:hypothetical protein
MRAWSYVLDYASSDARREALPRYSIVDDCSRLARRFTWTSWLPPLLPTHAALLRIGEGHNRRVPDDRQRLQLERSMRGTALRRGRAF